MRTIGSNLCWFLQSLDSQILTWSYTTSHNEKNQLLAICDACNGWPEYTIMLNMTPKHAACQLDRAWLCCYPRPEVVIYNIGTEFTGCDFQELLESYGVKCKPTTTKNLQTNSLVKHLMVNLVTNSSLLFLKVEISMKTLTMVQAAAYVVWATVPSSIPHSPLSLACGWDIIFCQKVLLHWDHLKQLHQQDAEKNNSKRNKKY